MGYLKAQHEIISDKNKNPVTSTEYIEHNGKWLDETLDEIKKDYVTPQMYGAIGDGVTDDTNAIQLAFDYCRNNGGGKVLFPKGNYKFTECLRFYDNTQITGQSGAVLHSYVAHGTIMYCCGSFESEIPLSKDVVAYGGDEGLTKIETSSNHGLQTGDYFILRSQRDACSNDSGNWRIGTTTANTRSVNFAEPCIVNEVVSNTSFNMTGDLTFPLYKANKEPGVDTSQYAREHSTICKANFLKNIVIENLEIVCHGGGISEYNRDDNTVIIAVAESPVVNNCKLVKKNGHGRGFVFSNCLNGKFINCELKLDIPIVIDNSDYPDAEDKTHVFDNHFTFSSSWFCKAINCTSIHGGQSFDNTFVFICPTPITDITTIYPSDSYGLRCPVINAVVDGCYVFHSCDNGYTNHSGAWMPVLRNTTFIGGVGITARSPHTIIKDCIFIGSSTEDWVSKNNDHIAILLSEPTLKDVVVSGCTFNDFTHGIWVEPYVSRGEAPLKKYINLVVENNTFKNVIIPFGINAYYADYGEELAKSDLGVIVSNNRFAKCGGRSVATGSFTNIIGISSNNNGVIIKDNVFSNCDYGQSLISIHKTNHNCHVDNNIFIDCFVDSQKSKNRAYISIYKYSDSGDDLNNTADGNKFYNSEGNTIKNYDANDKDIVPIEVNDNLLSGTRFETRDITQGFSGAKYYLRDDAEIKNAEADNEYCKIFRQSSTNSKYSNGLTTNRGYLEKIYPTRYTVSMDIRAVNESVAYDGNTPIVTFLTNTENATPTSSDAIEAKSLKLKDFKYNEISTEWTRVKCSFNLVNEESRYLAMNIINGATIDGNVMQYEIRAIKLEYGDASTEWCPTWKDLIN